jgi:hypothetical protein
MKRQTKSRVFAVGFLFCLLLSFAALAFPTQATTYYNIGIFNSDPTAGTTWGYDYTTATVLPVGIHSVASGDSIGIMATANASFSFFYFDVNGTGDYPNGAYSFFATGNLNITAHWRSTPDTSLKVLLTVVSSALNYIPDPLGSVSWYDSTVGSTTTYGLGSFLVTVGSGLTFTATPVSGYAFDKWILLDSNGTALSSYNANPLNIGFAANVTIYATFKLAPTPSPTIAPSINVNIDWLAIQTTFTSILMTIIGLIVTIIGVVILMRAPGAWFVGLILLVAGFFITELTQPSLIGLGAWSLTTLAGILFLYNASSSRKK